MHVGGHSKKTWIDEGALKFLVKKFNIKTFLDIGCGPGGQIEVANNLNLKAFGLDGDPEVINSDNKQLMDFSITKASSDNIKFLPENKYFDLGWSTEFLEHVDAKYIENFMPAFSLCKYVVITHATPGQGGFHHVNEQPFEYWDKIFNDYGLIHDNSLTKRIRKFSTMSLKKLNHFQGYNSEGQPVNIKKRSSFMKKTGRVFINQKI